LKDPGVDGRITFKWTFKKAGCAPNLSISEERPVAGSIGKSNAHSDSKIGEEFLDKLIGP
jgi:hypothetical protein